jgi:tRNA threonylcarbamoyladenosine biosynthesis protein TsaB
VRVTWTLAIATATAQVSAAIAGPDGLAAHVSLRAGRRHGETLAPAIEALTRLGGVPLSRIDRVAVDVGPGLFTGLRVGVASAKALGAALDGPVVPVSSLDLLAHPHRNAGRPVVSVVDARRGEVFWAVYQTGGGAMIAATEPAVARPEELERQLPEGALLTGDGARRYFADSSHVLAGEEHDHPCAAVLADLAGGRPELPAEKVSAIYIRPADVRIGWEQR